MKAVKANVKFEKENKQTKIPLNTKKAHFVYRSIFTDEYYPSGCFQRTSTGLIKAQCLSADEHYRIT